MAVFDKSKVRTKWSDNLEGKKGWFSNNIAFLRIKVENENDVYDYGICEKGVDGYGYAFGLEGKTSYDYFYEDEREDKK